MGFAMFILSNIARVQQNLVKPSKVRTCGTIIASPKCEIRQERDCKDMRFIDTEIRDCGLNLRDGNSKVSCTNRVLEKTVVIIQIRQEGQDDMAKRRIRRGEKIK